MSSASLTPILAATTFLPALLAVVSQPASMERPGGPIIAALSLAIIGAIYALYARSVYVGWQIDLTGALWASAAATIVVFAGIGVMMREGWRLSILVVPYCTVFAVFAAIRETIIVTDGDILASGSAGWVVLHGALSILTYAIATNGALAATAGFMQQRALKSKAPTGLSRRLPSLAACDAVQTRLMWLCAGVLGLGLVSGAAATLTRDGMVLDLNHKTVFGILAFALIVALLIADRRGNLKTRQVGRAVLTAYLLLTLAYLGVKFVSDIVLQ